MSLLSGISDFFGLDIGTTAVRLVQLHGNGPMKSLVKYAYAPLEGNIAISDSPADHQHLAQIIRDLYTQAHMTTKNVAVGIPSQRVFTTVVDVDRLAPKELAQSIHYQADTLIPTPLDESKIDWALLGTSPVDKTKVEILLSSVPNKFIEQRLDLLESAGLNVVAFEPDNLALVRALVAPDATSSQMILDIASKSTDLVINMPGGPRLTRAIPTGVDALIKSTSQNLNIDTKQAEQFVFKFGLSKEKLEGQVYQALISSVDLLAGEIEKSIKFFQTRYAGSHVERLIVTGGASVIPEFPLYLANKFNLDVGIGNAWQNVSYPSSSQNDLAAVSNQFSVAVGLAERTE